MQLTLQQFSQHLQQDLASIYLFHGDELLLQIEAIETLKAVAYKKGYQDRQTFTVESGFSWQEFMQSTQNYSLFSAKQWLELRIPTGKPGVQGATILQNYAQESATNQLLVITLPRLDKITLQSAWFKALESKGIAVNTPVLERSEWFSWLQNRFTRQQQTPSKEALEFLIVLTEGNLIAAKQEVEKLGLLYPAGEITFEQVAQATTTMARYSLTQLSEAWLSGETARTLQILQFWQENGEPLQLLVWQLTEDMHALALMQRAGGTHTAASKQVIREARVWGPRLAAMQKALRYLKPKQLVGILEKIALLDRLSKGGKVGWDRLQKRAFPLDPWEIAKELVIEITLAIPN